jgi:hypothetical protein
MATDLTKEVRGIVINLIRNDPTVKNAILEIIRRDAEDRKRRGGM